MCCRCSFAIDTLAPRPQTMLTQNPLISVDCEMVCNCCNYAEIAVAKGKLWNGNLACRIIK